MGDGDVESLAGGAQESGESPWFGGGLDEVSQGSPRVAGVGIERGTPKGCMPLGTYRVEKTRGLIDEMGTVGLPGNNGHNGSIKDHVA